MIWWCGWLGSSPVTGIGCIIQQRCELDVVGQKISCTQNVDNRVGEKWQHTTAAAKAGDQRVFFFIFPFSAWGSRRLQRSPTREDSKLKDREHPDRFRSPFCREEEFEQSIPSPVPHKSIKRHPSPSLEQRLLLSTPTPVGWRPAAVLGKFSVKLYGSPWQRWLYLWHHFSFYLLTRNDTLYISTTISIKKKLWNSCKRFCMIDYVAILMTAIFGFVNFPKRLDWQQYDYLTLLLIYTRK